MRHSTGKVQLWKKSETMIGCSTVLFNTMGEVLVNFLSMFMLLFADDIALFTTDPASLQKQLDAVASYSNNLK